MKIVFVLPGATNSISGGYKVIYTYANLLSRRGHNVTILYDNNNLKGIAILYRIKPLRKFLVYLIFGKRPRWFALDKSVIVKYAFEGVTNEEVKEIDALFATAAITAEGVANLNIENSKKYYFVQDHEYWVRGSSYAEFTYKLDLNIITISKWIKSRIEKNAEHEVDVIPNGIDFESFYIENPIEKRNPFTISMLYHILPGKGSRYGIDALIKIKKEFPEIKAIVFGTCKRPKELPRWISYLRNVEKNKLRRIYNHSAIFLCPVIQEGFGLTGAESLACGCALVSTKYGGGSEYMKNLENALLCQPRNSLALYRNLKRCILDTDLRIKLAKQGARDIHKLSWERAVSNLEEILMRDGQVQ